MNNHSENERIARLEGVTERVLYEVGDLKQDLRHSHMELKGEIAANRVEILDSRNEARESALEARRDFRLLLGVQITSSLGLATMIARIGGWI
jgi:hypothetical protein